MSLDPTLGVGIGVARTRTRWYTARPMNAKARHPKSLAPLRLKKNEERRLRAGHLWVFSNEVDSAATPLPEFDPGQAVEIQDARGHPIGTGYVNPHSLICARLVSRNRRRPFSDDLIHHRLRQALALRERLYPTPFYRWVYGESDGLPGLIVDRYGDVLVVQVNTAGMERCTEAIVAALDMIARPTGVLLRNDNTIRELEGLPAAVEVAAGHVPDHVVVEEAGASFKVLIGRGQKTGWFFDQRENRLHLQNLVAGRRVLDAFSYVGGWGVGAALAGAEQVVCVDDSASALQLATENAALNGVEERFRTLHGDAFKVLKEMSETGERFDVVVLDPPAFVKRKKDLRKGTEAYRRLNELAMRLLSEDAILVTCSCSSHLAQGEFVRQILGASRSIGRELQVLTLGGQGPDHPIHPAIPETAYLKAVFARVLSGF